jgi:hypothetical protein
MFFAYYTWGQPATITGVIREADARVPVLKLALASVAGSVFGHFFLRQVSGIDRTLEIDIIPPLSCEKNAAQEALRLFCLCCRLTNVQNKVLLANTEASRKFGELPLHFLNRRS